MNQRINDRGVLVDTALARSAVAMDDAERIELNEKLQILTGLENPNSAAQLKRWLAENETEVKSSGSGKMCVINGSYQFITPCRLAQEAAVIISRIVPNTAQAASFCRNLCPAGSCVYPGHKGWRQYLSGQDSAHS